MAALGLAQGGEGETPPADSTTWGLREVTAGALLQGRAAEIVVSEVVNSPHNREFMSGDISL